MAGPCCAEQEFPFNRFWRCLLPETRWRRFLPLSLRSTRARYGPACNLLRASWGTVNRSHHFRPRLPRPPPEMTGFLFDENLPRVPALLTSLPITHALDLALRPTDSELWEHSRLNDLAIV